ncbi:hypothetical protein [Capnocytophaga catalasegens]|uniref:Viral A-type inclusion protein n=1 Tax=Capnocytophaga catalasegens TaxID=1004260 RepID=A0AAV5AZS8_9FLAO|nr:hypothetical protein [Capnocytophaga catalasegens]GIZ15315.1 hypothetical protein RCZ03_13150 [Capnocytophaga catalasegens]GJM50482.1 hypothetical protein RCZ15_14550 [Capnocytophaga catalasegens]GJM52086.1 hypothetical protein RCZ16_04040 [Capnocytophaga catalasegens]
MLEESLDKQLSIVEVKYARKKLALQQENEDIQRSIEDLQQKIQEGEQKLKDPSVSVAEKSDVQGAIEAYQKTISQKQSLIEQNNQREITLEETLQRELNVVREKYSIQQIDKQTKDYEKRINRLKTDQELEIAEIQTLDKAKQKLEEQGYKGQLSKIKTLEDAKKQLKKQANKEILEITLESLEIQQQLLTDALKNASGETTEKLLEDLDKVKNGLVQVKNTLNGDSEEQNINSVKGTEAENVDVLGFTAGQWEDVFNNLNTTEGQLKAVDMAMQALANAGSMFTEAQRSANEKELKQFTAYQERRKRTLENQLNSGLITQEQYYNSVKQMETDAANKKAELEEKQFKAEKAGRLFSAIG